jgi:hypothetical protein
VGRAISEFGRPRKLIAADGSIAKVIRGGRFQLDLVVGEAPGLTAALAGLDEAVMSEELGWLGGDGVDAAVVHEFAETASELLESMPWDQWDEDQVFSVAVPTRGIEEGGLFVLNTPDGDEDEDLEESGERAEPGPGGWMMVFSPEDLDAMMGSLTGQAASPANALSLHFRAVAELSERLAEEARDLGIVSDKTRWVATLHRSSRDGGAVAPSASDYQIATALCAALVETSTEEAAAALEEHGFVSLEIELAGGGELFFEGPGGDDDGDEGGDREDGGVREDGGDREDGDDGDHEPPPVA